MDSHSCFSNCYLILWICCFSMAEVIIDAISDMGLDDSPSNLAAATLFYVLTNDVSII